MLENDYVDYQTNRFSVHALIADNAYFRLFPYQVLQGEISLEAPESALLMEDFAKKLFGKENPLGKVLRFSNGKDIKVYFLMHFRQTGDGCLWSLFSLLLRRQWNKPIK